ncbi:MAG: hypothetical protein Q8O43_03210, partial [Dehalococcoidia bacterium]|nr:hypothetical protein [Dehalococcoidia bacterium]
NRTSLRFFAEFTLSDYEGLQNDTSIFIVRGWRHGAMIDWTAFMNLIFQSAISYQKYERNHEDNSSFSPNLDSSASVPL